MFVEFDWKDTERHAYGVIAQELEKYAPQLVDMNEETTLKSVHYLQLHTLQIFALLKRVEELENTIKNR